MGQRSPLWEDVWEASPLVYHGHPLSFLQKNIRSKWEPRNEYHGAHGNDGPEQACCRNGRQTGEAWRESQCCSCWLAFHQLGENRLLTFYPTLFLESFKQIDPHLSLWITAVSRLYSFFKLWLFTTNVSNTGSSKNKCDIRVEAGQQLYPYLAWVIPIYVIGED